MAIQFKGSDITGVTPGPTELEERELVVNTKDGKLFTKTPAGNIIEIGSDNINTGLETPTPTSGVHEGHRYINGVDSVAFLPLGTDATDLTYASGGAIANTIGASGDGSFTVGIDATAIGPNSIAIGNATNSSDVSSLALGTTVVSSGISSYAIGSVTQATADNAITFGNNTLNSGSGGVAIGHEHSLTLADDILVGKGLVSTGITGSTILGKFNATDGANVFTIGDGTSSGTRNNILSILSNGVMVLNKANIVQDIIDAGPNAVVTRAYLADANANNVVTSVNTLTGAVTLVTGDIAEGTGGVGSDNLWFTSAERAQIVTNVNTILGKENLIPSTSGDNGKILTLVVSGNGGQSTYAWNDIDGSNVNIALNDIIDVQDYVPATDGRKIMQLQGATGGTTTGGLWVSISRTFEELQLLEIGASTQQDLGGGLTPAFELSNDPYNWGINALTQQEFDTLGQLDGIPSSPAKNINEKYKLNGVIVDPADDAGDVTAYDQIWLLDEALNLDYDSSANSLTGINVQDAITQVNDKADTNSTNIGVIGDLDTAATDLVEAVNEVNTNTNGLSTSYRTETVAYTIAANDYVYTNAGANLDITMPVGVANDFFFVLDVGASFELFTVNLIPNGAETIMGANTSFPLDVNNREYKIIFTGTDWRVI